MSSSDDAELKLGEGGGTETLTGITNFLQDDGSAGKVLSASFIGLVVSPFVAFADVVQAIGTFFAKPFSGAGEAISALLAGLFEAPGDLLDAGADITETALRTALGETLAGIIAFPLTVGLVVLGLYIVTLYLREDETGDTLPGVPVDIPFVGVEEEDTVDE
ncbi:hypothetical protein [Halomicrobium katesii]|uniref:hypothetical protein n=1 Tax=Halomicrobium katesii TaxID=437163 RepID=UPI000476E79D|nr:hypothetical protein [Halomicrobium katesii]